MARMLIRDRNLPISKIVPLRGEDGETEELSLVASGHMTLPIQQLDQKRFWSIGGRMKKSPKHSQSNPASDCSGPERLCRPSGTQARSSTSAYPGKAPAQLGESWASTRPWFGGLRVSRCGAFPIRAADALHLGAALIWCYQKPRGRLFVCNDLRLGDAARQAGFTVEAV
jgi:hypothetical protein